MIPKQLKFLLIDDAELLRNELVGSLMKLGFEGPFIQAINGEEALKCLQNAEEPFEFIICDIHMPVKDGITFLREANEKKLLQDGVPVLMLTAENDRKIVVECLKQGATNYLLKPWDSVELAKKIISCWEKFDPPDA